MSTKTSIKRIALVAVSALGFGMVSIPSSFGAYANGDDFLTVANVKLDTATTTIAGRIGQQVKFTVTGSGDALTTDNANTDVPYLSVAASITSQPASSTLYPTLRPIGAAIGTTLDMASTGLVFDDTNANATSITSAGTATTVATLNFVADTNDKDTTAIVAGTSLATVEFTPTVAGVYTVVVWNEKDRAITSPSGGAGSDGSSSAQASLSGSESYQTFTINVATSVASATLALHNATSAVSGANGSLVKVTLKDAAGNAAALAPGEFVTLTPTLSGDVAAVNGSAVVSAAGAAYNLSSANFNASGIAWINLVDTVAESVTLTASINGGSSSSVTASYKTVTNGTSVAAPYGTSGFVAVDANTTSVPLGSSTITYKSSATTDDYTKYAITESLCSGAGSITGYTTALAYDVAALAAASKSAVSVTAGCASATQLYTVVDNTGTNTVSSVARAAGTLTVSPSSVNAVAGSSNTFTVTYKDNFVKAYANQTVTVSVAGKNPTAVSASIATDANGNASYSLTDANVGSATTDTVTFTAGGLTATASVTYGTNAVSTITLTTDNTTASVANDTVSAQVIDTSYTGAQGGVRTVTAKVKNAAGALLAGVPVTFTISGPGAAVLSTTATVYSSTSGTASASVYAWLSGTYTVTATAGGKSTTGTETFYSSGNGSVRTVSASVDGARVTATAKDRFGNPVAGATLYAKVNSGAGDIGGSLTATGTTDSAGQVIWIVRNGGANVSVSNISFSAVAGTIAGQTSAAKGYDVGGSGATAITATTAGTALVAEDGVGASFDAAGVSSATVDVEAAVSTSDSIDAANEATDAANAATDAANAAAEAADAATAAAQDAQAAVAALATSVASLIAGIKAQITTLTNLVIKIQKKVRA